MSDVSATANVHVPVDFVQHLSRLAQEGGNPSAILDALNGLPGIARFAPTVDISQPIQMLALEVGRLIAQKKSPKGEYVFLANDAIVTVDENTGEKKGLGAGRFVGFVESFCAFKCSGKSNRLRDGLSREDAALLLEQDAFRDCLRPLSAVHKIRLPVRRKDGTVELLPAGYDQDSGIFTCETVPYALDWTKEQAREWILDACQDFPWNGKDDKPVKEGELYSESYTDNRSLAVYVAALLGIYCKSMFEPGTLRPMFAFFANKPGTGKTRTTEMACAHVHGIISTTTAPKDEEKMDVKLETVARAHLPYLILDDIASGGLRSNALNKFMTSAAHAGRCFGSNSDFFEVPNVTQVFVTANDLTISEDLGRRALIAEFFLSEDIRGRKFKRTINAAWLNNPENRAKFLAACWAFVRTWAEVDEKARAEGRAGTLHPRPIESYEAWTGVVGSMVMLSGFADPLARPEMDVGGATNEDELRLVLIKLASLKDAECSVERKDIVEVAREFGLWSSVAGTKGDADPDDATNKKIGRQMQRWRAQTLTDEKGRRFQFGHKRKNSGASYPLFFLKS